MISKRILVIEDDDGVREVIQICLEAVAGWEVLTAASGREGLLTAEVQQPDAILLDVIMPDLDGAATFRQLQANAATRHIPTILLTAKAKISVPKQFRDLGVRGVLAKPFDALLLVDQIRDILNWTD